VDVDVGPIVAIYLRRGEKKDIIRIPFYPKIYVRERDFYRFEKMFGDMIIDVDFLISRLGLKEKTHLVEIRVSYDDYTKLRKIYRKLSYEIFHIDIYVEHMVIRAPSLNPIDIKIREGIVRGEYLWGLRSEIPPELRIFYLERERDYWRIMSYGGGEAEIFESLDDFLACYDPDIVISKHKVRRRGVLSIDPDRLEFGVEGIFEKAYFTYAMPRRAVDLTIGNSVESRQTHYALEMGIVLPQKENSNTYVGKLDEYMEVDVGGLIITPTPGIYENVVALDFSSLFPHIIVRYNLSYENVSLRGIGDIEGKGFLPFIVEEPLERRMYFKKIGRSDAKNRADMLKLLLVSCYGYAGKLDNRFGNFLVNFWINKLSREILLWLISEAKRLGLEVLYADTDSLFVHGDEEKIYWLIKSADNRGFPLNIEYSFRRVVFIRGRNGMPVVKRYYGVTWDGDIIVKGLMAVNRSVPRIVREFQIELISDILNGDKAHGEILERYIKKVITCKDMDMFKATVRFGKNAEDYKNNSWIARLARTIRAKRGNAIEILYTSSGAVPFKYRMAKYSVKKIVSLLKTAYNEAMAFL